MASRVVNQDRNLVEAVVASLRHAAAAPSGLSEPSAVLWTDPTGQWKPLIRLLAGAMPELFVLGPYDPSNRTGPVIWLRTVIDRKLDDHQPPEGRVPILYLPEVRRQDLRAAGECPDPLKPLVELQYRGSAWHQHNGRDWTVDAFLTSEKGLGLDIAMDARTREALFRALPIVAVTPVDQLKGRRLTAEDFDRLSVDDPVRAVLMWMNMPADFRAAGDDAKWGAFCSTCRSRYGFDPATESPSIPALRLVEGEPVLEEIWSRFAEAPQLYPNIYDLLRDARPTDLFNARDERRPTKNEDAENGLRIALQALATLAPAEARQRIIALDREHGPRRGWIWAKLERARLAQALEALCALAKLTERPLAGSDLDDVVQRYAAGGWEADKSAMEAMLGDLPSGDQDAVATAVKTMYLPWLDETARAFQGLVAADGSRLRALARPVEGLEGTCVVFVDGLRFDVGGRLQAVLEGRGLKVEVGHRVVPLPTVTFTGKPFASPAHDQFKGTEETEDFRPVTVDGERPYASDLLRRRLADLGVDVMEDGHVRMASNARKGAWIEIGDIDDLGHKLNDRLVSQIEREIEAIADKIYSLVAAGWETVRVVTDHGWLFMPGSLPKVELPRSVVANKSQRVAALKGGSQTSLPTYSWHWNPTVTLVSPPGVGVFYTDVDYAHGGVTLQECVVPDMVISQGTDRGGATIGEVVWNQLRCRVKVTAGAGSYTVDMRPLGQTRSILATPKEVDASGEVKLIVEDDDFEGKDADIVILDGAGSIVASRRVKVGG